MGGSDVTGKKDYLAEVRLDVLPAKRLSHVKSSRQENTADRES